MKYKTKIHSRGIHYLRAINCFNICHTTHTCLPQNEQCKGIHLKKPLTFVSFFRKSNTEDKTLRNRKLTIKLEIYPESGPRSQRALRSPFCAGTQEPECESGIFEDKFPPPRIVVEVITPIRNTWRRNQTTASTAKKLGFGAMWWWVSDGSDWKFWRMRERGERERRPLLLWAGGLVIYKRFCHCLNLKISPKNYEIP